MEFEYVVVGKKYETVEKIAHIFNLGQEVVVDKIDFENKDLRISAIGDNGKCCWVSPKYIKPLEPLESIDMADITDITEKLKQIRRDVLNGHDKLDSPFLEGLKRAYELGKESK